MQVVLIAKDGRRSLVEVAKPEMCIRLQSSKTFVDYELNSIDFSQRLIYAERVQ